MIRLIRYLVDVLLLGSGYVADSFERHLDDFRDVAPFLGSLHESDDLHQGGLG